MKNLKLTTGIVSIAFIILTAMSCKGETKKTDTNENMHTMETNHGENESHDHSTMHNDSDNQERSVEASSQKNPSTTPIIEAYLHIKNGLAADSKENAAHGATELLAAFSAFDMSQLKGKTHNEYMEILESAKEHAEHITKNPIDHQREHFESLSTDINDLVTLLGTEKTLYKDFCPMVNNNKGGYWLSEVKEIKNPYFGAKMLKCGSIKAQIN